MPKISLAGFTDPVRRPRYVIWTGVLVLVLAVVVVFALGATSTRWFCAQVCHKVQDDTIVAYQNSTHSEVSCMACHEPVDPISFVLAKAKSLGELYLAATNNYSLPLNADSELSMSEEMGSNKCVQCHSKNRVYTPSSGIIIDHKVHADDGIQCTICHNRIAHNESVPLKLKDPSTGKPNRKHPDFMKMTPCFRCHSQEPTAKAPGTCTTCHSKDFPLKPQSHLAADFLKVSHVKLAKEDSAAVAAALAALPEEEKAAIEEPAGTEAKGEPELPPVDTVSYCHTCHLQKFCDDCHKTIKGFKGTIG